MDGWMDADASSSSSLAAAAARGGVGLKKGDRAYSFECKNFVYTLFFLCWQSLSLSVSLRRTSSITNLCVLPYLHVTTLCLFYLLTCFLSVSVLFPLFLTISPIPPCSFACVPSLSLQFYYLLHFLHQYLLTLFLTHRQTNNFLPFFGAYSLYIYMYWIFAYLIGQCKRRDFSKCLFPSLSAPTSNSLNLSLPVSVSACFHHFCFHWTSRLRISSPPLLYQEQRHCFTVCVGVCLCVCVLWNFIHTTFSLSSSSS